MSSLRPHAGVLHTVLGSRRSPCMRAGVGVFRLCCTVCLRSAPVFGVGGSGGSGAVRRRARYVKTGGSEKSVKLHRSRGKNLVRERIEMLIDEGPGEVARLEMPFDVLSVSFPAYAWIVLKWPKSITSGSRRGYAPRAAFVREARKLWGVAVPAWVWVSTKAVGVAVPAYRGARSCVGEARSGSSCARSPLGRSPPSQRNSAIAVGGVRTSSVRQGRSGRRL